MKTYGANSKAQYELVVATKDIRPGDRIDIRVPGRGHYIEVARINNDGSTRQLRRALKRENTELALAVDGVDRKKRRALGRRAASHIG